MEHKNTHFWCLCECVCVVLNDGCAEKEPNVWKRRAAKGWKTCSIRLVTCNWFRMSVFLWLVLTWMWFSAIYLPRFFGSNLRALLCLSLSLFLSLFLTLFGSFTFLKSALIDNDLAINFVCCLIGSAFWLFFFFCVCSHFPKHSVLYVSSYYTCDRFCRFFFSSLCLFISSTIRRIGSFYQFHLLRLWT